MKMNIEKLIVSPEWQHFVSLIDAKADASQLRETLQGVRVALLECGVDENQIVSIVQGWETGDWKKAIIDFGDGTDNDVCFYTGPMTPNERIAYHDGLVLLKKNTAAGRMRDIITENVRTIGEKVFGFPCDFNGRYVELYDLVSAAGSMKQKTLPIALFTPFYFHGWKDLDASEFKRRTILFHNVVKERFLKVTYPNVEKYLYLNDKKFDLRDYDEQTLDDAISLWLLLHELMHSSGPLPLFNASVKKLDLGHAYGSIEEARVDMSAWTVLDNFSGLFGDAGVLAKNIILFERVFRSSKRGVVKSGEKIGAEGEHGLYWLNMLVYGDAAQLKDAGSIHIDAAKIAPTVHGFLGNIYYAESTAIENFADGHDILQKFSEELKTDYLSHQHESFEKTQKWISNFL